MSVIGGPLPDEADAVDLESLLVVLAELRRKNRQLREDRDYYRTQTYHYRKERVGR